MKKRHFALSAVLAAVAMVAVPGCSTNTQGDNASPVFLVGSFSGNFVPNNPCVNTGVPLTVKTTTVSSRLKNPTVTSLQFLDVTVEKYTVVWGRIDGGTKTSPTQDFVATGFLIAPNSSGTCTDCPYMTSDNLQKPPLDQLFPFNGGIDKETGRAEIRQSGSVTWYGHTLSGQPVVSTVATFDMIFLFCGSTGRIEAKRAQ